jgi:hypothetical protein
VALPLAQEEPATAAALPLLLEEPEEVEVERLPQQPEAAAGERPPMAAALQ